MAGQMVHIEIPASDTAKGKEFWGSLFGWEFQEYGEGSDYHMARIDDRSGVAVSGMEGDQGGGARTYFDVEDTGEEQDASLLPRPLDSYAAALAPSRENIVPKAKTGPPGDA